MLNIGQLSNQPRHFRYARHLGLVLIGLCATSTTALATDTNASQLFGARETVQAIDLSPDGTRVVYLTPGPGRSTKVMVANLSTGAEPAVAMLSRGAPDRLSWCRFASNTRLVCRISGITSIQGILAGYTRLIAVGIDGSDLRQLGQRQSAYDSRIRQFDGEILDWLPKEPGAVLMSRDYVPEARSDTRLARKENGLGVDRIDVASMKVTQVEKPTSADYFITDGEGQVRIMAYQARQAGTQLSGRTTFHYRRQDSKDWQPFSTWDGDEGMLPLDVDAASNNAYVLRKLDGRLALYRVKLDGSMKTDLVYRNERVDVDGVIRAGPGTGIIGVSYAEEKRHIVYFDPVYEQLAETLAKALPQLPMVDFLASSANGRKLLVHAGSDSDPGRYYLYDRDARSINELLLSREQLEHTTLAQVRTITYPASDGTSIPAYLTLPPGTKEARGLPGIVLPHGGPTARDEWGFDWLAQFLAHQGYAVLQPNYRGSAGYGDAWMMENGFRSWRTSVGDVVDAGKWLEREGIAAHGRLAILGWSYGGYAALQSGVVQPDLFKAIIAIAPVTDFELLKQDASHYTNQRLVKSQVGSGAHTREGSPLQNAQRISAPVLLFHGTDDLNVSVEHSRRMDAALRKAGKSSELVVFDGLEHSLADSDVRKQMLDRIADFLKQNLRP